MGPNDRIHKIVEDLGYCCPYAFFGCNQRKSDSKRKLAQKSGLSISTIKFNKRKFNSGEMKCEEKINCQRGNFEEA